MSTNVDLYDEKLKRAKKYKSGKRSGYHIAKSRKPWRIKRRAPVRDSKRSYRSAVICAAELRLFCDFVKGEYHPHVPNQRVKKTGEEKHADEGDAEGTQLVDRNENIIDLVSSDGDSDDEWIIDISNHEASSWPETVTKITSINYLANIVLPVLGAVDWCGCKDKCFIDVCANATANIFCADNNCKLGSDCGNRPREVAGLEIRSSRLGLTVFTNVFIPRGTVVGEYLGDLTDHDFRSDEKMNEFVMALKVRSSRGKHLFVDAEKRGGITHFVNHSCDPNCHFFEVRNRRRVAVLLYAIEDIRAGKELSTSYGDELWCSCECGADQCVSKNA